MICDLTKELDRNYTIEKTEQSTSASETKIVQFIDYLGNTLVLSCAIYSNLKLLHHCLIQAYNELSPRNFALPQQIQARRYLIESRALLLDRRWPERTTFDKSR